MSNYRLVVSRVSMTMSNDLRRWSWRLERKDNTIGYTDRGETYTKVGAYLTAKNRLRKAYKPANAEEYDL